jgi:hypothetical protein
VTRTSPTARTRPPSVLLAVGLLLVAVAGCGSDGTASPGTPGVPVVTAPSPLPATAPASAASGVVRDAAGRPVAGVLVAAVGDAGPVPDLAVVTDAEGRYTWPAVLAPGSYELRAQTADGPATGTAVVAPGASAQVDLEVR